MTLAPCIPVPSPGEIHEKLFPRGVVNLIALPPAWQAKALLTPFGGLANTPVGPSDQLLVGNLTYHAVGPSERFIRIGLYLLESLQFFDLFFRTSNGITQWWWLISDPANPNTLPTKTVGPFTTPASVPLQDFLTSNKFSFVGSWKVIGRDCDGFSGRQAAASGTWYWFDSASAALARIMNVDSSNDFKVAVLGAFYLADFPSFQRLTSSNLPDVYKLCSQSSTPGPAPSQMVTLADIQAAMATAPVDAKMPCTIKQIQAHLGGISMSSSATPPAWTNRMQSECYMIGQDLYPYYCQVWYDWDRGYQVTVFVQQDNTGSYNQRFDELLPKGAVGPAIVYSWNGAEWMPTCCMAGGGFVPMPVPNFVQTGQGRCRALIANNPYFGSMSIWSVALGGNPGSSSDFWYWFNDRQQGVIFSLAPAGSLTMIDYQTFVQNATIESCVFENPCSSLPQCQQPQQDRRARTRFV
jgi:hypothetical protein